MLKYLLVSFSLLTACSGQDVSKVKAPLNGPLQIAMPAGHEARGKSYALSSQGQGTSAAGQAMLDAGGNVVDAFAAMSFAISVERPHSTGLGGGGFLLLQLKGWPSPKAFDFRERAPFAATEGMYLDKEGKVIPRKSVEGALSAGTPGLVRGVLELHRKYGKLSRAAVMAPAIKLAEDGFPIYPELARAFKVSRDSLAKYPSSAAVFLKDGQPLEAGAPLVQKDLAKTLRAIAKKGAAEFYSGETARALVASQKKWGGLLEKKDLADYRMKERRPVHASYRGQDIYSMPPPSSGGVHVLQMLGMLENDDVKALGVLSPASVHLLGSAMELAFRDRAEHLGDPDFQKVPTGGLQNKKYLETMRARIPADHALDPATLGPGNPWPYESPETTHFSILDHQGNAVATTQTINGYFGSGLVAEGTGVLFNNEMDDFGAKVGASNIFGAIGGQKNLVQPGKRPLSSMAPTIVTKAGAPVFVTGSPSGTRIISCVFLSVINHLGYGLNLSDSIATLRFHHQWQPGKLFVEPGFPAATVGALRKLGHEVEEKDLGCRVEAAALDQEGVQSVADPRGFGSALAR
ncbi:MAG: gamma-glutamyltransferase [Proteobacteria bacterium]|nr:MAG: gamma-glutamyltransferase [Pseudomonadota bacterium]